MIGSRRLRRHESGYDIVERSDREWAMLTSPSAARIKELLAPNGSSHADMSRRNQDPNVIVDNHSNHKDADNRH